MECPPMGRTGPTTSSSSSSWTGATGAAGEVTEQVGEDLPARFELLDPGDRDFGDGGGGDDPVVAAMTGGSGGAVTGEQRRGVAEYGKAACRLVDQHGVDVDGYDIAVTEAVRRQGGVVAGAGADLQHPHAILDIEGFEHAGHQRGHGRGTGRNAHRLTRGRQVPDGIGFVLRDKGFVV
jgi:hypothetical protein